MIDSQGWRLKNRKNLDFLVNVLDIKDFIRLIFRSNN